MTYPKITLITPSFNQGAFLEETIRSVLDQGYPNLEYIIVDGGSTDESLAIIQKYESRLAWWVSEKDRGQSHAINKGIEKSSGVVLNWLCSDDTLCPGSLMRIGKAFYDNPGLLCYTGGLRQFEGSKTIGTYPLLHKKNLEQTLSRSVVKQPSTFFSRTAINAMGLLNEALHYTMDTDWMLKFLLLFKGEGILEENEFIVSNYRLQEQSKSASQGSRFVDEHSSLIYAIARHKGLNSYAELLGQKGILNGISFPEELVRQTDPVLIEHLACWYCLRNACKIYTEKDFRFAQGLIRLTQGNGLELEEDEKTRFEFLNTYVKNSSWFRYRLNRFYQWHIHKKYLQPDC